MSGNDEKFDPEDLNHDGVVDFTDEALEFYLAEECHAWYEAHDENHAAEEGMPGPKTKNREGTKNSVCSGVNSAPVRENTTTARGRGLHRGMVIFLVVLLIMTAAGFCVYSISTQRNDRNFENAREEYYTYAESLADDIQSLKNQITGVSILTDYEMDFSQDVQYDYIEIYILLDNSFDDQTIKNRAQQLYDIESYIIDLLIDKRESSGYAEQVNTSVKYKGENVFIIDKILIEFKTTSYTYHFGTTSYRSPKDRDYTLLSATDYTESLGTGYVGYNIIWTDGKLVSIKEK